MSSLSRGMSSSAKPKLFLRISLMSSGSSIAAETLKVSASINSMEKKIIFFIWSLRSYVIKMFVAVKKDL